MLDFLLFIGFVLLFPVALASLSLATWVPTRKKDLPRIFAMARLRPGELFCDLGCGDGRVIFYGARTPEAGFVGFELAWPFYIVCQLRRLWEKRGQVNFKFKNIFRSDLSQADVVYVFAGSSEKLKGRLTEKLKRELKKGTRVITYAFPIKGWVPALVDKPCPEDIAIYLYYL